MANKIYALLVGINDYHPESYVRSLKGCVNDIGTIETYLRNRIATENKWQLVEDTVVPWKLTNNLATRKAIAEGFLQHLCKADSEDVVLFYYAGHGSQEPAPEYFWDEEPDRKLETLVCYDSRIPGGQDLADKELSYLIEQAEKNNPHILVILDSCHSGTATRDPNVRERERQINPDGKVRDLKDFLFPQEWLDYRLGDSYKKPKHVAISACRNFQTAKEHTDASGQPCGAFSHFLAQSLQNTNGALTYAALIQDVNALITGKVNDQSPQIEAPAEDLRETFLGGAAGEHVNYFTLTCNTQDNWEINGGIIHGIRPISEGKTSLAIFPQGTALDKLQETESAICEASLSQVLTEKSIVKITDDNNQLSPDKAYWAIVTDVPLPQLKVYFQGNDKGIELARKALSSADGGKPSLFVRETESITDAHYILEAINFQYWINQPADKQALVAPVPEVIDNPEYTRQNASTVIKRLEHIARWRNILELKTPPTSQIKAGDVEMEVIVTSDYKEYSSKKENSTLQGKYTFEDNNLEPPGIKVIVTNNSDKDLYFQIIELIGSYAIDIPEFFDERSSILLRGKKNAAEYQESNVIEGDELNLDIPKKYLDNEITDFNTIFKLIVSTKPFDASLLYQKGLDSPPPTNRSSNISGTLNRLMDSVYTRDTSKRKDKSIDNWMTQEVKINLVVPPNRVEIQESESTNLYTDVQLEKHSGFKGQFRLKPLPSSSRSVYSNLVPPIFLQQKPVMRDAGSLLNEAYKFNKARSGGVSVSVLEIVDVQNHKSVTPENPIKLIVDDKLLPGEHILPVAYDGEFFLPLGKAKAVNGKTEITIESLPEPTINGRSLHGSINILFQKLACRAFGKNYVYPLLRIAEVYPEGGVFYKDNQETIKQEVAKAKKILLYIHGVIGDTKSLLPSVQLAKFVENGSERTLKDKYDLVLAFDYENINTTIQENAKRLKQGLEEVGLGADHGKQLHIVAHSMGGLVSRTFIEQEGGNKIVQHLVMLGTPNGGSPWPQIQDWAFTALGIGLNQLASVAWPVHIITALLTFLSANDNAVDQMKPDSDFIYSMGKTIDPNVQYTIIAGDRSIRSEALAIEPGKNSSQIQRLMQKLFGSAVDKVVDTVFFQQPNDIAVTLESIKKIDLERNPKPIIISPDAACDHLTYFTEDAGLKALVQALCNNS